MSAGSSPPTSNPVVMVPVDLRSWMRAPGNLPNEEKLIWGKAGRNQMRWVRDILPRPLIGRARDYREAADSPYAEPKSVVDVVAMHGSKSVHLPVYYIDAADELGVEVWLRGNFHDWKLSVKSERPVEDEFGELVTAGRSKRIGRVYCEGFRREWVFPSLHESPREFTIETPLDETLFTIFWLLNRQLKGGEPE